MAQGRQRTGGSIGAAACAWAATFILSTAFAQTKAPVAPEAFAARVAEAQKLIAQGKKSDAEAVLDSLAGGKSPSAAVTNNYAVALAAVGKGAEARAALEQALEADPTFRTVYRNLVKLNHQLADTAYKRAFASANTEQQAVLPRLDTVTVAIAPAASPPKAEPPKPDAAVIAAAPTGAAKAPSSAPAPVAPPAAPPPKPEPSAVAKPAVPVAPPPPPAAAPSPQAAAPTPPAKPAAPAASASAAAAHTPKQDDKLALASPAPGAAPAASPPKPAFAPGAVESAVRDWVRAWQAKETDRYLASYADDFRPRGMSRSEWLAQRRERVNPGRQFEVRIDRLEVRPTGERTAVASFVQHFSSAALNNSVRKELALAQGPQGWKIVEERIVGR